MAAIIAGISFFSSESRNLYCSGPIPQAKTALPTKTKRCRQRDGILGDRSGQLCFTMLNLCLLAAPQLYRRCSVKRAVLNLSMKIMHTILLMAAIGIVFAADAAAQAQMSNKKIAETGKIEVLWLGQSATRITTVSGKVIVIDPFLTQNPKTPPQYKNLDALGKVDLILVTHAHGDH